MDFGTHRPHLHCVPVEPPPKMPEHEEWKICIDHDEMLMVSNRGRFYRRLSGRKPILGSFLPRTRRESDRNTRRTIHVNGKPRVTVSHLVAHYFIGPRPDGKVVDHINGDPLCNWSTNLRYVTPRENSDGEARNWMLYKEALRQLEAERSAWEGWEAVLLAEQAGHGASQDLPTCAPEVTPGEAKARRIMDIA
jgi:hypothetical protein